MSPGPDLIHGVAGALLFALGIHALLVRERFLRKVLGLNVSGSGVFLILVAAAYREEGPPDPVPHAMVLTGLVVAVSATALALALIRRIHSVEGGHRPGGG
ncbi:MAG: NADH-quinone oxidoreductase subunit K [Thiohalorhabdus sp.]|uniref:NADH-quinone oxidoreductase subunit K n=1 Tax=Thiohalorhabdus sp. TaxID=3094134 RepID=UPI00397F49DC